MVSLYVELTLKTGFRCNTERGKADLTRTIRAAMEVRQAENALHGGSLQVDALGLSTSSWTLLMNRLLTSSPDLVKSWVATSSLDPAFLGRPLGWWHVDLVRNLMSGSRGLDLTPLVQGLSSILGSTSTSLSPNSPSKWTSVAAAIAGLSVCGRRTRELLEWYATASAGDAGYDGNGGADGGRMRDLCRCAEVCAARGEVGRETVKVVGERMREIGMGGLRVRGGKGELLRRMGECMAMGVKEGYKEEGYKAVEGWGIGEGGGGSGRGAIGMLKAALAREYGGSMKGLEGGGEMMDVERAAYNFDVMRGARRGDRSNVKEEEEIPDIEEDDDEIPDIFGGEADEDDL
ncbi:hypothetical protein TrRE_jg9233 [Triparma retinervis]|uniref:Uncharacterized protein n=1 Tax=Triparma retinervis TaxID=2557542 RepID=A0A9W7G254_9STRA|nr:hypothetical protein TrRE_jg9233 [Triparma retinervis]